jgi:RNA polymerase sigma factor (sigma-70 family)
MGSDDELLAAWRMGDQRAGNQLFSRHFRTVRVYFANKVDASELEDLVQRTFEACIKQREGMAQRASVAAYLLGIAHNLLCRHWRERARHPTDDIEEHSIASLGAGPSSIFAHNENDKRLVEALRRIPLKYQEVLELYYWEGLNGRELAEALGVGEETARSKLSRAKKLLGRRMEQSIKRLDATDEDLVGWARRIREQIQLRPASLGPETP